MRGWKVRSRVPLLGWALLAATVGCRTASTPSPQTSAGTPPLRTNENLNAVLWMQTSAEYRASAQQAYRLAAMQLDAAMRDARWTAAVEQTADPSALPPAVILDLDETVLDNSAFEARQMRDGQPFSEEVWDRWCEERRASAIPGAVRFLEYVKSRGVTPIYITNRDHKVETATRDVLAKLGVPIDTTRDTVLTRHENGWDASDKSARRQFIAASYRVLLLLGRQLRRLCARDPGVNCRPRGADRQVRRLLGHEVDRAAQPDVRIVGTGDHVRARSADGRADAGREVSRAALLEVSAGTIWMIVLKRAGVAPRFGLR